MLALAVCSRCGCKIISTVETRHTQAVICEVAKTQRTQAAIEEEKEAADEEEKNANVLVMRELELQSVLRTMRLNRAVRMSDEQFAV